MRTSRAVQLVVVLALLTSAIVACLAAIHGLRHLIDFGVYLYGGDEVLAGRSPYSSREPGSGLPFTYPPIAAWAFEPLAVLPYHVAKVLWLGLVVGCAVVALGVLLRQQIGARPPAWLLAAVVGAAFVTEPYVATVGYGQINTILLALVVVDAVLVRRGSSAGGMLTGIAAALKLTPAVFVLYWLITGRYRAAGRAVVVFAVLTIAPVLLAPSWAPQYWTHGLTNPERLGWVRGRNNQSLLGMVGRWWIGGAYDPGLRMALFALALIPGLWLARRAWRAGRDDLGLAIAAVVSLLATPASWDHHYVWATPLVLLMASARSPRAWRLAAAAAVLVFVVCPPRRIIFGRQHSAPPGVLDGVLLSAYVWVALGLLVLVGVTLARRAGPFAAEARDTRTAAAELEGPPPVTVLRAPSG